MAHVALDFLRPILDGRDILEEHGMAVEHAQHQITDLPGVLKGGSRLDANHTILAAEVAGRLTHVGPLNGALDLQGRPGG